MAWNEPGGNSGGNRNPWGNRPEQGPPNLDEVVRNLQRKLSDLFGGGKSNRPATGGPASGGWGIGALIGALLIIWALTGFYRVDAAERAIILRFGKYVTTAQPGLNWRFPWPIETKQIVNVGSIEAINDQMRMLTSDENLVEINLAVQFRRSNPYLYAFKVRDPEATLREVSESAIRETIGRSPLDVVLGAGRQEIAARTKNLIQRTLDSYNAGIEITTVNLQGVSVPEQVASAQEDAIKAIGDRERETSIAQTYRNDILPKARGDAEREIQDAEAYRAQKIGYAVGEAKRFAQLLTEYELAPAVTRERLYLETIEEVLHNGKKVFVDAPGTNSMIYLPLDKLVEQMRSTQREVPKDTNNVVTVTRPANPSLQESARDERRQRGSR